MKTFRMRPWLAVLLLATPLGTAAATADFLGEWMLFKTEGRSTQNGILQIYQTDDGVEAMVENGPVRISIDGDRIAMAVDDWGRAGGRLERFMTGTLKGDRMEGTFGPENPPTEEELFLCKVSAANCPHPEGSWYAERYVPVDPEPLAADQMNIFGAWRGGETGLRRWSRDVTDKGAAWLQRYDVELDLPRLRCMSAGLWGVWEYYGSMEFLRSDADPNVIVMLIGAEVRRIYMDDRRPSVEADFKPVGYSYGEWQGNTLVVTTTHLLGGALGFNGNPVSNGAQMVERYTFLEPDRIEAVISLIDPENYNTPPIYRRILERSGASTRIQSPVVCDPDSFYRGLYYKGMFDAYNERSDMRF